MTEQEVVELAVKHGVKAGMEYAEKRLEDLKEKQRTHARANTKKLLKSYNELKAHCESAITNSLDSTPSELEFVLKEVFNRKGLLKIEGILASKRATEIIINHIDMMLEGYYRQCEMSGKPYFEVIQRYYLQNENIKDIADTLQVKGEIGVSERTVYNYLEVGEYELSVLIFGIYAVLNLQ